MMAHLLDELLLKQPEAFVELVYAEPAAVLSIYQRLSGPARHLLLRFLYQPDATLDKKQFAAYFLKDEDAETVRIELTQRFLLKTMTDGMLTFGSVFLDSLRTALAGRTDAPDQAMPPPKKASEVTPAFLEEHSRVSWEAILSYMTTNAELKNSTMILILQEAQLIVNDQPPISVTPEGFQFLLQDRANQVWLLIVTFLKLLSREEPIPGEGLPMHEALVLLFRIGLGRLNEVSVLEFSAENLTTMQITFLRQLHYMGVVYHRNRKSKRFFLTPYAVMLYHNAELALSQTETGFLLAETNFHVYAYTDSAVKVALLSKFATLTYRLPIMTTAIITRTSVRRALSQGITADQILRFMQRSSLLLRHHDETAPTRPTSPQHATPYSCMLLSPPSFDFFKHGLIQIGACEPHDASQEQEPK
ncbi:uncharacterized protein MONBRDRAFT_34200 [Monosiga brevicollis MX1]|uniref:General transcription factor IIH subunit 4 n=1 Tax=Monosiga brevicollis TaxID=81824 RepID=A9VA65_MONBE|nr:uncharacterized protein MONBRDRAFT_34200 [Monosiga brevicollis MX1]EDQ85611.1 predicted protein [Monosiga brevicollis MX1]|eukprot:XP_001749560.1 hypothetical protein [Monosiga brevicollis MX1]